MRIPFVPKDVEITQERFDFVKEYRGGGFMLIGGSIYWLLAFLLTYVLSQEVIVEFYTWGGLLVPVFGFLLYKILGMSAKPSQYSSLVGFASATIAVCIPILLLIRELDADMLLPVLCVINAAHLLILCWVHLDYWYFLLVAFGVFLGFLFIYTIPAHQVHFLALIWGIVSLVVGIIIHLSTRQPLKSYDYVIRK